jgi:hypothetical protein
MWHDLMILGMGLLAGGASMGAYFLTAIAAPVPIKIGATVLAAVLVAVAIGGALA